MKTPKIDLIVTRHPALVAYLSEIGIADASTPVIAHATADDVRGKHVLGILPHHLSCLAATLTEIPMRTTEQDRADMQRGGLSLERLRLVAGEADTFTVERGWSPAKFWPVSTEPHPNGRDVFIVGGDRTAGGRYYLDPIALRYDVRFDTRDLSYYRDGGSWVIQGWMRVDAAAWGAGRVEWSRDMVSVERRAYETRCSEAGLEPLPWREAVEVPCAVIMAVEWHDLAGFFSAGSSFEHGKPVAPMQHEPLVLFGDGRRARVRLKAYDGDRRMIGTEIVQVGDDGDQMRDFITDHGPRRGRCRNEADLIPIAERALQRRLSEAVDQPAA